MQPQGQLILQVAKVHASKTVVSNMLRKYVRNLWWKNHRKQVFFALLLSKQFGFVISNVFSEARRVFSSLVLRKVHTQLYKDFSGIPHSEKHD